MKEIAFTVFPVRVVTATQDCSYIDPVHGLQHADNRDRITVDNGSAVGFVYYSGAYPDDEDIDAIKGILRTMRDLVKEELEADRKRRDATVGDLGPVFAMVNDKFQGEYFAGERLAPVLLRLLGERERCARLAERKRDVAIMNGWDDIAGACDMLATQIRFPTRPEMIDGCDDAIVVAGHAGIDVIGHDETAGT